MGQGFYFWSKTANNNATADASINYAEGMAPSAVNDSARAAMARTAEWRDDISGTITTGGTSTAYTVTSNQVFDTLAHMTGAMLAFVPHTTSGATVTLNVDGLGAKPLRSAPSVELPSGFLVQGTPYVATYNNSDAAWYLQGGFVNPYNIPLGGMMPYTGTSAPNSAFAIPVGQQISQTTYATLYSLYGANRYGADGGGNFFLPDLRGRAVFGLGTSDARITVAGGNIDGTILGNTGGLQNHTLTTTEIPAHTHNYSGTTGGGTTGTGTTGVEDASHTHTQTGTFGLNSQSVIPGFTASGPSGSGQFLVNANTTSTQTVTISGQTGTESANHHHAVPGLSVPGLTYSGTTDGGAVSGAAHTILPPAMILPYILRII